MKTGKNSNTTSMDVDTLFSKYAKRVYRWAMYLGASSEYAEEIAQEVFIVAMKKKEMPVSEKILSAWLFQITRKLVANHRRSSRVKKMFGLKVSASDSSGSRDQHTSAQSFEMRQILQQMPLKLTEVLIMHDLDGYTRKEAARILGIAEGTVASRLAMARATFVAKWEESANG